MYFKEPSRFSRLVAFIYDDCDRHELEKVDGLRNALIKRDRIDDVGVIQRPSVIPRRSDRA